MDRVEFWINGNLRSTDTAALWSHDHWFTIEGVQNVEIRAYAVQTG